MRQRVGSRLPGILGGRAPLGTRKGSARAADATVIDGEMLIKLDRLTLGLGRDLVQGLMGEHRARRRTQGIEFADYRQYSVGDDLRRVDWNAYARLGTLHVRQAQAEHDTVLYMLVDASPSMGFGEPPSFLTARRLAAALGYIALAHLDRVVVSAPGTEGPVREAVNSGPLNTYRGRAESAQLFRHLQEMRTGQTAMFDNVLTGWSLGRGQGRVAVVISDLMLDGYREGIRQLVGVGFEVTLLHLLSPEDMHPTPGGDFELVDSETGERLEVHLGDDTLRQYHRHLDEWMLDIQEWCRSNGAAHVPVQSDWNVERIMLETLRRRGVTA